MANIIDEILKVLPKDKISDAVFEAANIVLYTKDKDFLMDNRGAIKEAVNMFKKRIELRPDPSINLDMEETEKIIRAMIPEEAGLVQVTFDQQRSRVIIETEKPGLAIGKQGEILRDIKEKTMWVPLVRRTSAIKSNIIESIKAVLYQNSDYRRKFLNKTGHRIYDGWIRGRKEEWVRITSLGGGRQVGRSCFLLQTPESRVLMDCGINVAATDEHAYPHLEVPEFKIDELDAIIITHSHLDHSGFLPYLFKFGYRGPVYCTAPTRDVMSLLALDNIKIAMSEGKEPLYSQDDIKEMVKHTICLDFEEVSDITPDVRITLYNAGHILGSAIVHLHIGNGLHNLVYTGDMKYGRSQMLEPAISNFPRVETLMIESTYGGKEKIAPPAKEEEDEIRRIITETVAKGGKVLFPVLGSGRAQDILILIEEMVRSGQLKSLPVYIDGMVWDITAIHTAYPEFLNSHLRKLIFHKNTNPFLSEIFKRVGSAKERKEVIENTGSCIILATSGMLVGGPSVEYLKNLGDNPNNSLLFTCYQAEGSLGKRIQNGEREFNFGKNGSQQETLKISMFVDKIEISDHADRKQLMNYVGRVEPRPKKIIIVHGESSGCLDLASSIHKQYRIETLAPRNLEAIRLR